MPLRPLRASDIDALSAWLPRTAAELRCDGWSTEDKLSAAIGADGLWVYREQAGDAFLACASGTPAPDAARIELLAVAPRLRRLGIGSRAALALERRLGSSVRRIYAVVPSELGLAFYFWLRLGYRPLTRNEWSSAPERAPAVWMMLELR